jgi:AcrR family transcriptional regulator
MADVRNQRIMEIDTSVTASASANDRKTSGLKRHARQRNDESLTRIRSAARTVFVNKGYIAVTMEELAREAGVTRQTLYRHFPSKYDLALDFMEASAADTLEVWRKLCDYDLADGQSVLVWVQSVIDHHVGREYERAYVELMSTEPAYRQILAQMITQIVCSLAGVAPIFSAATEHPDGLAAAKAHLFVATLIERSDFIAIGEEWFAREHLEAIMTDWLMLLTHPDR